MVTGATGLLGSHLLCHLARCGETIIALKRYKSHVEETMALFSCYFDSPGDAISRVTWVVGDVLDGESVAPFVEKVDTVYHCADMVSFNGSDRNTLLETNIKGTENICKICLERGVRLCFVSSIAALGDAPNESVVIDEKTPEISGSVDSLYSGSKGESEKIVWESVRQGLDVVIVNPAIILGAGLRGRSSVKLFEQASKGMPFYTEGVNGYVDVRDVCELMIRLAKDRAVRGERFVLCGGNYSYRELFTVIARVVGKRPPCIRMTPWMTGLAWRLLAFVTLCTGKKRLSRRKQLVRLNINPVIPAQRCCLFFPIFIFPRLKRRPVFSKICNCGSLGESLGGANGKLPEGRDIHKVVVLLIIRLTLYILRKDVQK